MSKDAKEQTMPSQTAYDLAYLMACALSECAPQTQRLKAMDLPAVRRLARRHSLDALAAQAVCLAAEGDVPAEVVASCRQTRDAALRRAMLMNTERNAVFAWLDAQGIWHAPTKGDILQRLYPATGLRQMADIDFLFDAGRADELRAFMEGRGYATKAFGTGAHDAYLKAPVYNFEPHRVLFSHPGHPEWNEFFGSIRTRLEPVEGTACELRLPAEDTYLHLATHAAKHLENAGTGLRILSDLSVYLHAHESEMNWGYVMRSCDILGIADLEKQLRMLAHTLMDPGFNVTERPLSLHDQQLLLALETSGTYGTIERGVRNAIKREGGTFAYYRSRLLPSLAKTKSGYPVLERHPYLYPAVLVYRLGKAATVSRKKVWAQIKAARVSKHEDAPSATPSSQP